MIYIYIYIYYVHVGLATKHSDGPAMQCLGVCVCVRARVVRCDCYIVIHGVVERTQNPNDEIAHPQLY